MNASLKWTGERLVPSVLNEIAVEHLARYAFCKPFIGGKKVLDVACGEGYGSRLLASSANEVVGVDIDEKTINYATNKYQSTNLRFINASALNLPFDDKTFDVVVSFETIEHITRHHDMLKELKRVMKKEGLLIISTPDKEVNSYTGQAPSVYHQKELTKKEFSQLLQEFFINSILLHQQNLYGSFIFPESGGIDNIVEMQGDFDNIANGAKLSNPAYMIALATDGKLPYVNPLFFDAANIYEKQVVELKNTWTYRIGAFVLKPLKWVKMKWSAK